MAVRNIAGHLYSQVPYFAKSLDSLNKYKQCLLQNKSTKQKIVNEEGT